MNILWILLLLLLFLASKIKHDQKLIQLIKFIITIVSGFCADRKQGDWRKKSHPSLRLLRLRSKAFIHTQCSKCTNVANLTFSNVPSLYDSFWFDFTADGVFFKWFSLDWSASPLFPKKKRHERPKIR